MDQNSLGLLIMNDLCPLIGLIGQYARHSQISSYELAYMHTYIHAYAHTYIVA